MKILDVIRRPDVCPRCGGEICDILYGEPTPTWEEDYLRETGHRAVLGGCIITEDAPDYKCPECRLKIKKLSFPRNVKSIAFEVLQKAYPDIFSDVEYCGIYNKQMIYQPVVKPGVCWDGMIYVYVRQNGNAFLTDDNYDCKILSRVLEYSREKYSKHTEHFYKKAALRAIKDDTYYKSVRKCGMYRGKRAYQPILKDEFIKEPPCTGLPLVILVDNKGRVEYVQDELSFEIYSEIRKQSRKK